MKKAFTMIELIFVIVIIGILSAIAIPKMAVTRDDAILVKARATVGALRSAISMERQKRILQSNFDDVTAAEAAALLDYGLGSNWAQSGSNFTFTEPSTSSTCVFTVSDNKLTKTSTCTVSGMSDL